MNQRTRTWLIAIASIILIILTNLATCKIARKPCPTCKDVLTKSDTTFIVDTDTVEVKGKTRTRWLEADTVKIVNFKQLDSLKNALSAVIEAKETELQFYKTNYEALAAATIGDYVIGKPPHVVFEGEHLSKDGTAKVKWSVEVKDSSSWVQGDSLNPNPVFYVESLERQIADTYTYDNSKPNAIAIGAILGSDGKKLDAAPLLELRIGNTAVGAGYFVGQKFFLLSAKKELKFGRRKKK